MIRIPRLFVIHLTAHQGVVEIMSHTVVHVTDPEGDFSWVEKNIKKANAAGIGIDITYNEQGVPKLHLQPEVQYVCGGDLFGNGPQNLKLLAFFEQAQKDYPGQVVKIAGNRDIIMTRLYQEVSDLDFIRSMIQDESEPRWIEVGKRQTFKKACEAQSLTADTDHKALQAAYLKWALEHTMGSAKLFNSLKAEFGLHHDGELIDALLDPDFKTRIFAHLKSCDSMCIIDQVLYSHGALTANAFKYYGLDMQNTSMDQFVHFANRRYHQDLLKAEQGAYAKPGAYVKDQPEQKIARGQLNHDALPNTYVGHGSIVTASYEDKENPVLPSQEVIDYLARNHVRTVIIGHKPFGDKATFLQGMSGDKAVQFILADSQNYRQNNATEVVWFQYHAATQQLQAHMRALDQRGQEWMADYPVLQLEIQRNFVVRLLSNLWSWIVAVKDRISGHAEKPATPLSTDTLFGPITVDRKQQYVVGTNADGTYAAYYREGYKQMDVTYTEAEVKQHRGLVEAAPAVDCASATYTPAAEGVRQRKTSASTADVPQLDEKSKVDAEDKKSKYGCTVS